jgi:hypothetical protein
MRVQIPGETQRDYRYLLGLTLSQTLCLLIGGALALQVHESDLLLSVQMFLWLIISVITFLFAFVRWPLRGGEPFWVWVIRWVHFILLEKRWTYGREELTIIARTMKPNVTAVQKVIQPLTIPIHPLAEPVRIQRGRKPLVAQVGDMRLYFTSKGRDVFVTIQNEED